MTTELPTPQEWLNEQLAKKHMTQNELARRLKVSSSTISRFANGTAGAQTAINIASFFDVPATVTLALIGKTPPPPSIEQDNVALLSHIYRGLPPEGKKALMSYAEYLQSSTSSAGSTSTSTTTS